MALTTCILTTDMSRKGILISLGLRNIKQPTALKLISNESQKQNEIEEAEKGTWKFRECDVIYFGKRKFSKGCDVRSAQVSVFTIASGFPQ